MVNVTRSAYFALVASLLSLMGAWRCRACDVPVCRYALEHWTPDSYVAAVLHQGPLDAQAKALAAFLERDAHGANLVVQTIDADHPADEAERTLCQANPCTDGPQMVLRFPAALRIQSTAWKGRLTADNVATLLNSPRRREVADRLLAGDEMVWVLLLTGRKDEDDAAAKCIEEELKRPAGEALPPPKSSLVRVSRNDAAEKLLTETLLSTEPDLHSRDEPMAFPIFGRGRVLYALVGAGINAETLRHALAFLTGGCSCTVKRENPGVDLLLRADWSVIIPTTPEEAPPTPAATVELVPLTPLPANRHAAPAGAEETPAGAPRSWILAAVVVAGFLTVGTGWLALRSRRKRPKQSEAFMKG